MSGEGCPHGHWAPNQVIEELPEFQGGNARHRCPYCAYYAGYHAGRKDGLKRGYELAKEDSDGQ